MLKHISRRRFLHQVGGTLVLLSLAPGQLPAATAVPIRKPIPASGELLPVIGMGTSRTFDAGADVAAREELAKVLRAFFEGGGSLIDSSPMYGTAEAVVGELLRSARPPGLFAATKVWIDGEAAGVRQMEASRQLWGVERLDLIQVHNLRDWLVQLKTLRAMKQEKRVRYIGITTSHGRSHRDLEAIMRSEPLDFVQFSYSITDREVEQRLLPLAAERGIATLINRPFERGEIFDRVKGKPLPPWAAEIDCASWGQFFLKFVASHPAVTCVIPATSKLRHMVDNMGAGFGRLPDAAQRQQMLQYFQAV